MASISERLKALGVSVGGSELSPKRKDPSKAIENVVQGETEETDFGEAFFVDVKFPTGELHGSFPLRFPEGVERLAIWAQDFSLVDKAASAFLFIDTETTGLSGAAGTLAFMVGVGRFHKDYFWQRQYFLRDPSEEPAMLASLERFAAPADAVVSFNGKSFDIPLLNSRYLSNAAPSPFTEMAHVDLLHLARRLWREVLVSRTLGNLEEALLGVKRSSEDIPGWLIPEMYTDYLRTGDAEAMTGVFYHNALDVRSMVTLLALMASKLEQPLDKKAPHAELFAIARLLADLGLQEDAIDLYHGLLNLGPSKEIKSKLIENLAWLHRRKDEFEAALKLWEQAAGEGEIYAHVEIAKYYEHQAKDFSEATRFATKAMKIASSKRTKRFDRLHWSPLIEHRLKRLESKQARKKD